MLPAGLFAMETNEELCTRHAWWPDAALDIRAAFDFVLRHNVSVAIFAGFNVRASRVFADSSAALRAHPSRAVAIRWERARDSVHSSSTVAVL